MGRRRALRVRAHAKVNLDLQILGRRADGYHELRTVFQSIALHDTLVCIPQDGPFALACDAPGVPTDGSNLVWRAAEALWAAAGRPGAMGGARVRIEKRIPAQAGLGGGSTDAGAALAGLARLWRLSLPPAAMEEVAATLGADVPYFLAGGSALGLGRGDLIYPLVDLPRHWLVLLIPPFGVSTADAFRWFAAAGPVRRHMVPTPDLSGLPPAWPARVARLTNDLEAPVAGRHPAIRAMKAALRRAGARAVAMSGSGSTVFGLFGRRQDAVAAAARLSGTGRRWRVVGTVSVGREAYTRRSRPLPASAGLDYT